MLFASTQNMQHLDIKVTCKEGGGGGGGGDLGWVHIFLHCCPPSYRQFSRQCQVTLEYKRNLGTPE